MKKIGLSLLVVAIFAYGSMVSAETLLEKTRSFFTGHDVADHDSVKEDVGCRLMTNAFCLAEKCGDDNTFCLSEESIKDLGITDEQRTKIRELCKEVKEKIKEQCQDVKRPEKGASGENCAAYRRKMAEACEKCYPECKAKLEKILGKEQIDRLQVRVFQYFGLVPNAIVLDVLDPTDAQKRRLSGLCEETCDNVHKGIEDYAGSERKDKEELKAKIRRCRTECAQKVRGILTREQLDKANRLLGETPEYIRKMKTEHDPLQLVSSTSQSK